MTLRVKIKVEKKLCMNFYSTIKSCVISVSVCGSLAQYTSKPRRYNFVARTGLFLFFMHATCLAFGDEQLVLLLRLMVMVSVCINWVLSRWYIAIISYSAHSPFDRR
jgi:hypothetical protein